METKQRVDINTPKIKPWKEVKNMEIHTVIPEITSRNDCIMKRREESFKRIKEINAPLVMYTDGSATGGTRMGGAAAVITEGAPEEPTELHTIEKKGALITCSYEEEVEAMEEAATWIAENCNQKTKIMICTDSLSLCMAMKSLNPETDEIRETLQLHTGNIVMQWVPGHSNIPGNDLADNAAKRATNLLETPRPITYRSACMQIKKTFTDDINHKQTREVYSALSLIHI